MIFRVPISKSWELIKSGRADAAPRAIDPLQLQKPDHKYGMLTTRSGQGGLPLIPPQPEAGLIGAQPQQTHKIFDDILGQNGGRGSRNSTGGEKVFSKEATARHTPVPSAPSATSDH